MIEMLINGRNIAEYGARLLDYTIGGTEITQTMSNSYNAEFPILFGANFGLRTISITLVYKRRNNRLYESIAQQKTSLDSLLYGKEADILLPDGYLYYCILTAVGNEVFDGQSIEVVYTLKGIRHMPKAVVKGAMPFTCYSTVKTKCKITATIKSGWGVGNLWLFITHKGAGTVWSAKIDDVAEGDIVTFDGIKGKFLKNADNAFGNMLIDEFPYLCSGKNLVRTTQASTDYVDITVEYYPTFI